MSEYKLLRDFGELVPGMKFKSPNNDIYVVLVPFRICGFHGVDESTGCKFDFISGIFIDKLALIHDPRKKEEMSEYKLLKDFGEIVPGMIFENYFHKLTVLSVRFDKFVGRFIDYKLSNGGLSNGGNGWRSVGCFERKYKLIHDPRKKNEMSIQEKINDHKKQIEILEKELQKESLKNVFVKDQYYKIKTKDDTFICKFGMSDFDKSFIWVECVDRFTKKFSTDDIQKVWHVENLKDVFGFCNPIFERKD